MTAATDLPLAVDLDGTLIHGDVFVDSLLAFLRRAPWRAPMLVLWLSKGRAHLKAKLAAYAPAPDTLSYDQRVLAWLRSERARGRSIVLASASDHAVVARVAGHLGLFDAVFASEGTINLKAQHKAAALKAAFPQGFVYAGNQDADMRVWEAATSAVLVNCSPALARRCRERFVIERAFDQER